MSESSLEFAERVVALCARLGATESSAAVNRSSHIQIIRRDGQVEQATEATTQSLSITVLVDDCYSSASTSDLRPEAVEGFVAKSIDAARYLEPDEARRHPDAALCGRGVTQEALEQDDPCWASRSATDRNQQAEALEASLSAITDERQISSSVYIADGRSEVSQVLSNGFAGVNQGAWFALGGERTIQDGERRPEAGAHFGARYLADLPNPETLAQTVAERVEERVGAGPIDSGKYPLVLSARAAGRILGILGGPLSGASLHQRRSCLADQEGEAIGSSVFTLIDDPTIPRGLGSRPWDGDALIAKPLTLVDQGVLQNYYIGVYHSRKLDRAPTTGGRSNWVIPPGDTPWEEAASAWPRAIRVTGFLGGNSNAASGDFSFGVLGQLLEHGKPTQSLCEMNISGNVRTLFHKLVGVGDDPWTWSPVRSPTLLFEDVQFSGL